MSVTFSFTKSGNNIYTSKVVVRASINDTGEFRIYLYDKNGTNLEREPDLFWKNIKGSGSLECSESLGQLQPVFKVKIFEQHRGLIATATIDLTLSKIIYGNPIIENPNPALVPKNHDTYPLGDYAFGYSKDLKPVDSEGNELKEPKTIGNFLEEGLDKTKNLILFALFVVIALYFFTKRKNE